MSPVRVLVADSQPLFASSVATALATVREFEVVEDRPDSWPAAISSMIGSVPDVALLDLWLQGSPLISNDHPSRQAQEGLRAMLEEIQCKLIIVSWMQSQEQIRAALEAGAIGFLTKSTSAADLVQAVKNAQRGQQLVRADELFQLVEKMEERRVKTEWAMQRLSALSPPELEVLIQLGLGRSPREVARELFVSHATVKARIHSILAKTGARSRAEILADARRSGLIQT